MTPTTRGLLLLVLCLLAWAAWRGREGYEGLRVGPSAKIPEARGVFALKDFRRGDVVERCPVVRQSEGDIGGNLTDYVFGLGDGEVGVAMGYGSMYNHSANPHLTYSFDPKWDELVFKARRPI